MLYQVPRNSASTEGGSGYTKIFKARIQIFERMFQKMKFITRPALKILHELSSDPMRAFYQREVAKEAEVSVGSANRALKILVEKELVTKERKGKVLLYKFNTESPVAKQLKILFNVNELDELVRTLKKYSKRVILFGSCAEGNDVRDSDIDLFILTNEKGAVRRIVNSYEASRKIASIIVDANDFAKMRSEDKPLYGNILRGIRLWETE